MTAARWWRWCLGCALLSGMLGGRVSAQDAAASTFELWGGIATGSPSWGVFGEAPGMNFGVLGLRFARAFGAPAHDAASGAPGGVPARVTEWHFDLVPLAMLSTPYRSLRGTGVTCPRRALCVAPLSEDEALFPSGSAYGFGVNPFGITTRFRNDRMLSPSLGMTVGGILFDRQVPTSGASEANFTAAIEAGLRIGTPGERGVAIAYRFHHISNGGTASENPGVASHLFTLAWRYGRGLARTSADVSSAAR